MIIIIYLVLFCIIVKYVLPIMGWFIKTKQLTNLLRKDLNQFLQTIEKYIRKETDSTYKNYLLMYKAEGLSRNGQWKEAISLLNSINTRSLSKDLKIILYSVWISVLFYSEKIKAAKIFYENNYDILSNEIGKKNQLYLERVLALQEFYFGSIKKSEEIFMKILKKHKGRFEQAISSYYLGLIYLKLRKEDKSLLYLENAKRNSDNYFIGEKIDLLLTKNNNKSKGNT